ncbi:alpha/beta fold hydrolase [Microbacterium sp. NPDC056569]|uniref:alpha/beta fold hydrolase n=1 Tax=Microbacterium sp. NPDC056569 TaxID=3345867 RepID=UPI00366B6F00
MIAATAVVASGVLLSAPSATADDTRVIAGQLDDSTAYRFLVPNDWNGTVFVDLDFASRATVGAHVQRLLEDGAAYGGTTRTVTGWDIASAIDNQVEALDRFADEAGEPGRAIAMGSSMGGFVAAGVAQRHPSAVDGVVSMCGGLSGSVSQWNQKLDTVFVLSHLLDPTKTLPVVGIPADVSGAVAGWQALLARAQETPEGRARIALAAAIGQLPAYAQSAPRPAAHQTAAYQAGWYGALSGDALPYIGQAMSSRRSIEAVVAGNPSWNTGVDYAEQLRTASPEARRVVERLYREAGLSLAADLSTVNTADRIAADPGAVERFAAGTEFDGSLSVPVVAMSNIGDQISTVAQQNEYDTEVRRAGTQDLLRQVYVESAGHCAFTAAEQLAAVELLFQRLDTADWSNGEKPKRMNASAEALGLGDSRFIAFEPDRFNRPYTLVEPAQPEKEDAMWTGALANGTPYNIHLPGDWNGVLVLDPDLRRPTDARVRWLVEQGYAAATRARDITDWDVAAGSADLMELKGIFVEKAGADPEITIVAGGSLGGLVTRDTVDEYGTLIDGAVPMCGGGAGLVGMWNHRLDATFVLDVLVGATPIELTRITDQAAADAALAALVEEASSTPEGRARLALAGAIGGVSGWPAGEPEPAPGDAETRVATMGSSIALMLLRRSVLEAIAGGSISWNVGVDYRAQFEDSGQHDLVRRLYAQAGVDLDADLAALAEAPRVTADAAAVEWARSGGVYDGVLDVPVLDLYTATDPRAALSEMRAYESAVAAAGSAGMLRQAVVDRSGHCSFITAEYAAAIDVVVERVRTGEWSKTTPAALNSRAQRLQEASEVDLGRAEFTAVHRVPAFPREFTAGTTAPAGAVG